MQAIILAHSEPSDLSQLTLTRSCCDLPVASSNLLYHTIGTLLSSDVSDILITHTDSQLSYFERFVGQLPTTWPSHVKIKLCPINSDSSLPDCLSRLRHHINAPYVFLVCSVSLVTNLDLRLLFLSLLRQNNVAAAVFSALPTSESKIFKALPREVVITDRSGANLFTYYPSSEIKKHTTLPRQFFALGSRVLIRNDLRDVGFYLFAQSEIDQTIRFRDKKKTMWQHLNQTYSSNQSEDLTSPDSTNEDGRNLMDDVASHYVNSKKPHGTCLYEHNDEKIAIKLCDPLAYLEAVRLYLQKSPQTSDGSTTKPSRKDCSYIGPNCVVDPKAFISNSQLTAGCTIGMNVRLINCVLLRDVVVKDGCVLQGCVLGDKVTLEAQCNLKNCAIAASQHVPAETTLEGEQLGFQDPDLDISQT